MKIEVGEGRELVLRDVYNGIMFITNDGQKLSICMRDGGFEIGLFCRPPDDGTGMKEPLEGPKWVSIQDGKIIRRLFELLEEIAERDPKYAKRLAEP